MPCASVAALVEVIIGMMRRRQSLHRAARPPRGFSPSLAGCDALIDKAAPLPVCVPGFSRNYKQLHSVGTQEHGCGVAAGRAPGGTSPPVASSAAAGAARHAAGVQRGAETKHLLRRPRRPMAFLFIATRQTTLPLLCGVCAIMAFLSIATRQTTLLLLCGVCAITALNYTYNHIGANPPSSAHRSGDNQPPTTLPLSW